MSKRLRVYELAKELGYAKQELVTRINELDLGIRVSNVMTVLSEDEVTKVKRALKQSAKKADKSNGAGAPVPIKRRKKKAAPAAEGDDASAVGPVKIRRNRRRRTITVTDDKETSVTTEELAAEPEAPKAEEEVAPEPVAEPAAAQAEAPEADAPQEAAEDEVAPEPVAEPDAPEEEAAPEPVDEPAAAEAEAPGADAPQEAEVSEEEGGEAPGGEIAAEPAAAASPEVTEVTEAATPAAAPPSPSPSSGGKGADRKGAKILGHIDLGTIEDRIGRRNFKPQSKDDDRSSGGGNRRRRRSSGDSRDKGGRRRVRDTSSLYVNDRRRGKGSKKRKRPKKTEITQAAEHKRVVRIEDTITVGELGKEMGVKAGRLALKLMEMGMMATVNTTLDFETAQLIAMEFDHTVENVAFDISQFYDTSPDPEEALKPRPPVVTVMGHVDHGKTSLLDAIRASTVTAQEAGGITQHIGAYTVQTELGGQVTFLDTPGHEAFTALRARGAQATDIVILVVAADDGVMPQTVEAINHSRDADVPIIVAVNKIDKPSANPDRVKQALIEYELTPEEWGGETQYVEVSALKNINVDELLEQVLIRAEIEELEANPDRDAQGIVIESELDIGRGALATVLVQRGTLRPGDIVVVGEHYGRVRTMDDHRGDHIEAAGPSVPVEITGLSGVPEAGEPFFVVPEEKDAKMITDHVAEQRRQKRMAELSKSGMDKLREIITGSGDHKKLKIIIKGDVQGSIEALKQAFAKVGNDEVSVDVIHAAVGGVTENDVNLAASSEDAIVIVGFNVRPDNRASEVAEKYGVEIMTCSVIYDAIDQIRNLAEGMLSPIQEENIIGQAEVRETFHAPKVGTIAGCYVTQGLLRRNARARLYRDGKLVYDSTIASLRRFKDDAREVKSGFECGASLTNFNDIKVGDIIEAYEIVEVAATL